MRTSLLPAGGARPFVARGGGPAKWRGSTMARSFRRWNQSSSFSWRVSFESRWVRGCLGGSLVWAEAMQIVSDRKKQETGKTGKWVAGIHPVRETAKAVSRANGRAATPLKRGVNEKGLRNIWCLDFYLFDPLPILHAAAGVE